MLQVTQFTCGGFVIGLESSHSVFDGLGSAQFLNCVAEFARGLQHPLVEPVWCREAIPKPPGVVYGPLDTAAAPTLPMPSFKLEQVIIDISLGDISRFKNQFFELTGHRCFVFRHPGGQSLAMSNTGNPIGPRCAGQARVLCQCATAGEPTFA